MPRIAIYPGTFDPITLGHLDVIKASVEIFDKVIVALLKNPLKKPMFSEELRLKMINVTLRNARISNAEVAVFHGLTVKLARQKNAVALIRGLRLTTEYETELNISLNNHILSEKIHTILIAPHQKHLHISSSAVRELLTFGEGIDTMNHYVPRVIMRYLF